MDENKGEPFSLVWEQKNYSNTDRQQGDLQNYGLQNQDCNMEHMKGWRGAPKQKQMNCFRWQITCTSSEKMHFQKGLRGPRVSTWVHERRSSSVQRYSEKTGRGGCFVKCLHFNKRELDIQRNREIWPNQRTKSLKTQICVLPNEKFQMNKQKNGIKMLSEIKENINRKLNEIRKMMHKENENTNEEIETLKQNTQDTGAEEYNN